MTTKFPDQPPVPSQVDKNPEILKLVDERLLFDKETRQWIFTDSSEGNDKPTEYQYNFIINKWIKITKHVMDEEELEEEANKEEIKQLKRQKLEQIKQEKQNLMASTTGNSIFLTNLSEDSTFEDLNDLFSKYGTIALDKSNTPRIKLYYDEKGLFKREALIIYESEKSVELSIQMVNETEVKGNIIKVEPAKFKKQLDDIKSKFYAKIVVIENMFRSEEFNSDSNLELDIETDIHEECNKHDISDIIKIAFFPKDTIVTIKFRSVDLVNKIKEIFNERYYDGLVLNVHDYDGTKYH